MNDDRTPMEKNRKAFELAYAAIPAITPTKETAWLIWKAALSAAPAQEPTLSEDDVHTLIGHAIFLRMEGKLDMPAYFFGLATRIAKQIGDAALAARAEELSASPLPQEPQEGKELTDAASLVRACAPFLKDGETPAECIARNRKDAEAVFLYYGDAQKWRAVREQLGEIETEFVRLEDLPSWIRKMQDSLREARAIERELRGAQEGKAGEAEAEFTIESQDGVCLAAATGPRAEAWAEIQHYAAQYAEEGPLTIYEVTRKPVATLASREGEQR